MSWILTRRPQDGDSYEQEQVYCICDMKIMGNRMFGHGRWFLWNDSGFPNQVMEYGSTLEAKGRLNTLRDREPAWDYKVEFYDR